MFIISCPNIPLSKPEITIYVGNIHYLVEVPSVIWLHTVSIIIHTVSNISCCIHLIFFHF